MIAPETYRRLQEEIRRQVAADRVLLDQLREEILPLRSEVRRVLPRTGSSISFVGADGGNNRLRFDPFLVQIVRVVDSSNNELCLDVVTPTTSIDELSARQFGAGGEPITALGELMAFLGVRDLTRVSPMIRRNVAGRPVSATWLQVYRELVEWAVIFRIVRTKEFATDTLLLYDGLLRSVVFADDLFPRMLSGLEAAIDAQEQQSRRRLYLAGIAKSSQVLTRYRLAMALEGILTTDYPAYVEVPRELEEKAYVWTEYVRGRDRGLDPEVPSERVGGKMFFVKFGTGRRDPIWPVDLFLPQVRQGLAPVVLGHLLADAIHGFPVPFYPLSLQRAHQNAALVEFDFEVLQDQIFEGIREILGPRSAVLDVFRLTDPDPAALRYNVGAMGR
jgi:hypothetical protein